MVVTDSKIKKIDEKEEKTNEKKKEKTKKRKKENRIHFATFALLHKKNQECSININVLQTLGTPNTDFWVTWKTHPDRIYWIKINNGNTKIISEFRSKWTPDTLQWSRSGVFTVDFEQMPAEQFPGIGSQIQQIPYLQNLP